MLLYCSLSPSHSYELESWTIPFPSSRIVFRSDPEGNHHPGGSLADCHTSNLSERIQKFSYALQQHATNIQPPAKSLQSDLHATVH